MTTQPAVCAHCSKTIRLCYSVNCFGTGWVHWNGMHGCEGSLTNTASPVEVPQLEIVLE